MFVGQGVVEGCRIVIYICITLPFEKHSIPWQVGIAELAISEKPFCGGTIIGPRTILSGTYLLRLLKIIHYENYFHNLCEVGVFGTLVRYEP